MSILSPADLIIYGMGELPLAEVVERLKAGADIAELRKILQTTYAVDAQDFQPQEGDLCLFSYEECLKDKKKQAMNFKHIEEESNKFHAPSIYPILASPTLATRARPSRPTK